MMPGTDRDLHQSLLSSLCGFRSGGNLASIFFFLHFAPVLVSLRAELEVGHGASYLHRVGNKFTHNEGFRISAIHDTNQGLV
ncbi:hypothetical protein SAMN04489842_2200 [Natronobacterium texcoconense]|uniref:Uncharacterized protein n=1 Tax=Natronobacterium texcoconense TaxID=1095778 RepID=A0A1H1G0Q1_NATTX|nr:hypothetical protein SAMN04489842_2200 [Natronobacterium texcoconense]